MRARLAGGFAPAPMLSGAWYPVLGREGDRVTISVDGGEFAVHESFLEMSDDVHANAVWAFDPSGTGPDGFVELATVVCPAGHHITGIGPSRPTCRCDRCGREYEIET